MQQVTLWVGFLVFVGVMLALDLGVFNRTARVIKGREALRWTAFLFVLALLFNVFVYFAYTNHWFDVGLSQVKDRATGELVTVSKSGRDAAWEFLSGYLLELSLSMDNVFVIALIFRFFKVPAHSQHRVLFWGILGALVLRGALILVGTELVKQFSWINFILGGVLLFSVYKMLTAGSEDDFHPDQSPLVKAARRFFPVSDRFEGEKFFTRLPPGSATPDGTGLGRLAVTPMFLVLLVVETTDVVFAFDSIPAIFGITLDPFIVFTSNVFAILGLRSLYFALASLLGAFRYLKRSLEVLLAYIGLKIIVLEGLRQAGHEVHLPAWVSLLVIFIILGAGILLSLRAPKAEGEDAVYAALPHDESMDAPPPPEAADRVEPAVPPVGDPVGR